VANQNEILGPQERQMAARVQGNMKHLFDEQELATVNHQGVDGAACGVFHRLCGNGRSCKFECGAPSLGN